MQFSLYDASNITAPPEEVYQKFKAVVCAAEDEDDLTQINAQDFEDKDDETSEETDDQAKPEVVVEKRKRKLRVARLKRKSIAARAYQFTGSGNSISGIVFVEISKIKDLPPERNSMTYSFFSN